MPKNDANDERKWAEGVHGEIVDSGTIFTVDKGQTYKDFWTNVSEDEFGAFFAVVGTPFDKDPTTESLLLSGEPEVQILVDYLHLGEETRVLEIGAGVGRLGKHILDRCGSYVGVDISQNMLDLAARHMGERDDYELIELGEAAPIPLPDESFDAVYSQAVLIHLDREECFNYIHEAYRLLKPGGRAYFQFYNLLHPEGMEIFSWVARNCCTPEGKVRGRVHFLTPDEVRAYVENAGFVMDEKTSHLERSTQDYPHPIPMTNYDYYLIAVAEKPIGDAAPECVATLSDTPVRCEQFSEAYHDYYVNGFIEKIDRHHAETFEVVAKYLRTLPRHVAFEVIIEIERAVIRARMAGIEPSTIFPGLERAVSGSEDRSLVDRVRDELTDIV